MAGQLRIIAGKFARRLIAVPQAADKGLVRPTTDKVRGAIFSSLFDAVIDARVLDIFAGSGAQGLEAISRGAARVVFVEKDPKTAATIKRNIESLGVQEQCEVFVGDAEKFVSGYDSRKSLIDIVFVDPPYGLTLSDDFWKNLCTITHAQSTIVFRFPKGKENPPKNYRVEKQKIYGSMEVLFLSGVN